MRTIIHVIIYLLLFHVSHAQVNPNKDLQKPMTDLEIGQMYLTKGKTQTKNGFVMLGIGLTMGVTGAIIASNNSFEDGFETGAGLAIAGTACSLICIPLFISGGRNKQKAKIILSKNNVPISLGPGNNKSVFSIGVRTVIK